MELVVRGYEGFHRLLNTCTYYCHSKKKNSSVVTENRSQKYLHYRKDVRASHDAILPPFVSTLLESNFGLIRRCMGHTHQYLAQLLLQLQTLHEPWKWAMSMKDMASAHSRSPAKVQEIIITVCAQSDCVLSYSLSQSSEETREFGTSFPRGQDSPNIQCQHSSKPSLYFHWRDRTRCRHGQRGDTGLMTAGLMEDEWKYFIFYFLLGSGGVLVG